jgi:hypothetical protein
MQTLNGRIFVEQYKKQELKATVRGGFALMAHKSSLVPLKILVDARLSANEVISAGSTAYIKEETLFLKTAAGQNGGAPIPVFHNEKVSSEGFHILDLSQVEMIDFV